MSSARVDVMKIQSWLPRGALATPHRPPHIFIFPVAEVPNRLAAIFIMKKLLGLLASLLFWSLAYGAAEKANTVLIHPGETIYVRFTQLGGKIKLAQVSQTLDPEAQVILTLDPTDPMKKKLFLNLKVENKFSQDLIYKAQLRLLTENRKIMAPVYPVVAGKMSLETFPPHVEEIAIFGYELER